MAMSFACRSASSVAGQQVAGELLADELVVGHVAVEGVDHPVAVAVHLRDRVVGVVAGGVGVADHVEPVPAPALAVGGRGEQPVDDLREGVRRLVRQERVDLLGRRRQAGQVEGRAADQRPLVGGRRGRQALRLELREDERGRSG